MNGGGQGRSQGRETRKSTRYLFHFHFEHSRTGEKTAWPWRAETRQESQLSPMSDLGLVTSPLGAQLPIYKRELPP